MLKYDHVGQVAVGGFFLAVFYVVWEKLNIEWQ
jgi:hypothetical protein